MTFSFKCTHSYWNASSEIA